MATTPIYNFIFIRHGEKAYSNGHGPQDMPTCDPPIVESSIEHIKLKAAELLACYGKPTKVIASPYLRTRQTAEIMSTEAQLTDSASIDTNISEFLGNRTDYTIRYIQTSLSVLPQCILTMDADVFESSMCYGALPKKSETYVSLSIRCKKFLKMLFSRECTPEPGTYWIITHGLIINTIRNILLKRRFSDVGMYLRGRTLTTMVVNQYDKTLTHSE